MRNLKLIALLILFLSLTTFNPFGNNKNNFQIFKVNNIIISGNYLLDQNKIKNDLSSLVGKNLTFVGNEDLDFVLKNYNLIKRVNIKKIFPNTIKLIIEEKKLIAIIQNKKKKFYLTEDGNLVNFKDILKKQKLPVVFGNEKSFLELYKIMEEVNFPVKKIEKYLFFEIGRWDIIFEDEKIIRLPSNDYKLSLENFLNITSNNDMEKIMIFDYRIKDQLILK